MKQRYWKSCSRFTLCQIFISSSTRRTTNKAFLKEKLILNKKKQQKKNLRITVMNFILSCSKHKAEKEKKLSGKLRTEWKLKGFEVWTLPKHFDDVVNNNNNKCISIVFLLLWRIFSSKTYLSEFHSKF